MKKIITFVLAAVVLFSFAECSGLFSNSDLVSSQTDNSATSFDYAASDNSASEYTPFYTSSNGFGNKNSSKYSSSSRYNYSSNGYSSNKDGSDTAPTFYSLTTLSKYLNEQKSKDVFEIPFKYSGNEEPEPQMLAQMVSAFFVNYTTNGELRTLTITEYPGDRIVDAYRSGNRALLTSDEKKAMDKAIQMVSTAKAKAKNNWELELLIHDMLADNINYYNDAAVDFDEIENAPRYISIVGALLDKKANCQGYCDAFYTLASIAGFTVSRMNVETPDDLHVVNTIKLNGLWYVVDVTFDDQVGDAPTNYRLFNAGLDRIEEFSWKSWKEINKISATSPKEYYYNYKGTLFGSANSLAQYVVNQWLSGEKTIRAAVLNLSNSEAIEAPLSKLLDKTGRAYNYRYWCSNSGKDLYYTFVFK